MTRLTRTAASARCRSFAGAALIAATTFAIAIPAAPTAYAQTESQIQGECQAHGGTYETQVLTNGTRMSRCCYVSTEGSPKCDNYKNGTYNGSDPDKAPPPVSGPAAPPANNAPIQTNPPRALH